MNLCVGSLRGTAWAAAVSSTDSTPAGFCSQMWELIFLALEPWARGPGVGMGILSPKISLLDFVKNFYMFIFREMEGKEKRKGEKNR